MLHSTSLMNNLHQFHGEAKSKSNIRNQFHGNLNLTLKEEEQTKKKKNNHKKCSREENKKQTVRATKLSDSINKSIMKVSGPAKTRLRIRSQDEAWVSAWWTMSMSMTNWSSHHFFVTDNPTFMASNYSSVHLLPLILLLQLPC